MISPEDLDELKDYIAHGSICVDCIHKMERLIAEVERLRGALGLIANAPP